MPRRARMYLSGYPYHIVQRGNHREACFVEPENYQYYLELWKECGKRYGVEVHAYRELFKTQIPDEDIHLIEQASEYWQPVGDDRFRKLIEDRYGIRLGQIKRGRPRKEKQGE